MNSFPQHIYIETTNVCNIHCTFCFRDELVRERSPNFEKPLFLSRQDFMLLADQVAAHCKPTRPIVIKLQFLGEPFAHQDLVWQVSYLKCINGARVNVTTNGTLLRTDKIAALFDAGLDELSVSINAASPDAFDSIRGGANTTLEDINDCICKIVHLRKSKRSNTKLFVTMVALGPDWEQQFKAFSAQWSHLVDIVAYRPFTIFNSNGRNNQVQKCCQVPFERMFLRVGGCASLCNEDLRPDIVLGNWRKSSLSDIWNGAKYEDIRFQHQNARAFEIQLCNTCMAPHYVNDEEHRILRNPTTGT